MRNKKSASANLENKRIIFFQIGIILSLAIALTAFEWKSYDEYSINIQQLDKVVIIEEEVPVIIVPKKPEPIRQAVTKINIIDDDPEIEPDDIFISVETTPEEIFPDWLPEVPDESFEEDDVFIKVEKEPEFTAGENAMF